MTRFRRRWRWAIVSRSNLFESVHPPLESVPSILNATCRTRLLAMPYIELRRAAGSRTWSIRRECRGPISHGRRADLLLVEAPQGAHEQRPAHTNETLRKSVARRSLDAPLETITKRVDAFWLRRNEEVVKRRTAWRSSTQRAQDAAAHVVGMGRAPLPEEEDMPDRRRRASKRLGGGDLAFLHDRALPRGGWMPRGP